MTSPPSPARLIGSGDIWLHGTTGAVDLTLEGSGNLNAKEDERHDGRHLTGRVGRPRGHRHGVDAITLSGSGDIDLFGGGSLETSAIDGSGDLRVH